MLPMLTGWLFLLIVAGGLVMMANLTDWLCWLIGWLSGSAGWLAGWIYWLGGWLPTMSG
jgi:hypothetical protein